MADRIVVASRPTDLGPASGPGRALVLHGDVPDSGGWTPLPGVRGDRRYELESQALTVLKEATHRPLTCLGGRSLIQATDVGGVSLMWLGEGQVYRYRTAPLVFGLRRLADALADSRPDEVVLSGLEPPAGRAFRAMAATRAVPTRETSVGRPGSPLAAAGRIALFLARDAARRGLSRPARAERRQRHVVFGSMSRERLTLDPAGNGLVTDDLILAPLLDRISTEPSWSGTLLYKYPASGRLRRGERSPRGGVSIRGWESYWTPNLVARFAAEVRRLHHLGRDLERGEGLAEDLDGLHLLGVPLHAFWPHVMAAAVRWDAALALRGLLLAGEALEVEGPEAVVLASETSLDNRGLVTAGRLRGIPVVALQHGSIFAQDDYLADYLSVPADFGSPSKASTFPDRLCVFGPATRDLLVGAARYPLPESVAVTGQPRFDRLVAPASDEERSRFRAYCGVKPDQTVVLVASQTFHIAGSQAPFIEASLRGMAGHPEWFLVVKPHPLEDRAAWEERARKVGVPVHVLQPGFDVHDAIRGSDVVVSFYSTVLSEAVLAGVPCIVLNTSGVDDPRPYVDQGVALRATDAAGLERALDSVLHDGGVAAALEDARRRFREHEVAVPEGGATDAVFRQVRDLVLDREGRREA